MMKTTIIRIVLLLLMAFIISGPFYYLDKECSFFGCSLLTKEKHLSELGIKVFLYTRCPNFIEFIDLKNNNVSCYYSMISNTRCIPYPKNAEGFLIFYALNDGCIFLCEKDAMGNVFYKKIIRCNPNGGIAVLEVDESDLKKIVDSNTKVVYLDTSKFEKLIESRNQCLLCIILLFVLLLVNIAHPIVKYKHPKRRMSAA